MQNILNKLFNGIVEINSNFFLRKFSSLKTYLDYPSLPHLKRELKQNSLQLQIYKNSLLLDTNQIN